MDDRGTNPPSLCGSETGLEYSTDFPTLPQFRIQSSNTSTKKSICDTFTTTPCIG